MYAFGLTLLPLPVQWDIRGWSEMHPLNGPAWSLYYEYIANIAYALVLRRLGRGALAVLAALAAAATMHLCLSSPQGDVVGGWSLTVGQQCWGLTRMAYPFLAGLLLARCNWQPRTGRHAFALCALALVPLLAVPQLGGETLWVSGLYEALCILQAFPLLVAAGSCPATSPIRSIWSTTPSSTSTRPGFTTMMLRWLKAFPTWCSPPPAASCWPISRCAFTTCPCATGSRNAADAERPVRQTEPDRSG